MASSPPTDLASRLDRLHLAQGQNGHSAGANGSLSVPGQGVRKRFTVPTALHSHSHSPSPVPSLPYQPPPPPVQTQSATLFHVADHSNGAGGAHDQRSFYSSPAPPQQTDLLNDPYAQYASYPAPPVPPTLAPEFLASPTGMSPYPGPAFRPPQASFAGAYGGVHAFVAPQMQQQLSGGFVQPPLVIADGDDEIIETAIVIKNIPFACPREQLLSIMASLALPAPFAFNYHFAPEDPTSFRGLAFANYRNGDEAGVVRAAMDGLEVMGRKLRCEFKKALKPGEKEAIERNKALKRMRSAQLLAVGAGGPDFTWNRREASAPGGYAGGGWNAGLGVGVGGDEQEDYGRPLAHGQGTFANGGGAPRATFGHREYIPAPAPAPAQMEPSYSSESASPPCSDVGTSVSQRMERGAGSGGSEVGTVATTASLGTATAVGRNDLDMNDPPTLELYSRVLLFQGDSLRDEFAFSRSLSSQQRRTVHLIAKKLGLEHRSFGDGEARHVVVYKPGSAPPPEPRRPLRGSVSTAALRRVISRDGLASSSHSRTASSSSYLPPPLPTSYHLSPSHTISGHSSHSSLSTSVAGLRGKKSMPDMRLSASGHILPPHAHHLGSMRGHSSPSSEESRSPSPVPAVPPMPTSISLSAHLAAYAAGNGYASASSASPLSSSPSGANGAGGMMGRGNSPAEAAFTRRSYSNLRSLNGDGGGAPSSPARGEAASPYATIAHFPASPPSSRRREIPSVQGLFQAHGIPSSSAPPTPARERERGDAAPGSASATRMPSGVAAEGPEWRRR
ncbi:Peptidyl-prolyl cis-trans isomerase pin4 [Rhodotorula kratochvilovae]